VDAGSKVVYSGATEPLAREKWAIISVKVYPLTVMDKARGQKWLLVDHAAEQMGDKASSKNSSCELKFIKLLIMYV